MAFIPSRNSRLILGDFALSGYLTKVEPTTTVAMLDTTVLTSIGEEFVPGLKASKFALSGLLDSDGSSTGQNQQIAGQLAATTDDVVSLAWSGFTRGNQTLSFKAVEDSYAVHDDAKSALSWDLSITGDDQVDFGVSLADLAAVTATTTGTAVDNAALTSNGGAGFLHVTAYSGFTNVVFKVQHSTDNSTFADLATFTTVTATTSERKVVAAATTVNRYVRILATVSGTGSVTFAAAFARR